MDTVFLCVLQRLLVLLNLLKEDKLSHHEKELLMALNRYNQYSVLFLMERDQELVEIDEMLMV